MYTTEFKTFINEPYIKIPEYEKLKGKEVRVILLNLDNQNHTSNQKEAIKKILDKNDINLFKKIKDPVQWQNKQREEWK